MRQLYKKREHDKFVSAKKFFKPEFSEKTLAAMREARLIAAGKIPAKSFNTVDELLEDLRSD